MKSFRVLAALYDIENDRVEVVKEITEDDNSTWLNLHLIPTDALEWRAAVYGIDDHDELVDLVLHEPFIEDVTPLSATIEDARAKVKTRVSEAKGKLNAKRAKNIPEHKVRLSSSGVHQKYIDAADVDPYAVIKQHCGIDTEALVEKRAHVEETREQLKTESSVSKVDAQRLLREAHAKLRQDQIVESKEITKTGSLPPIHL